MAIQIEQISPLSGETNVELDSEIAVRVYEDGGTPLNLSSLDVTVDAGEGSVLAIDNGAFVNSWTGEITDLTPFNNSNLRVVVIRPKSSPNFLEAQQVDVTIDVTT